MQRLMATGSVETYSVDGKTALRSAEPSGDESMETVSASGSDDEEATVEIRMSDNLVRRLRARLDD
ncbi:MAG: hypothetical protein R3F59_18665 [Myxococcota bacterium]